MTMDKVVQVSKETSVTVSAHDDGSALLLIQRPGNPIRLGLDAKATRELEDALREAREGSQRSLEIRGG
jgi:hypothetical protein